MALLSGYLKIDFFFKKLNCSAVFLLCLLSGDLPSELQDKSYFCSGGMVVFSFEKSQDFILSFNVCFFLCNCHSWT